MGKNKGKGAKEERMFYKSLHRGECVVSGNSACDLVEINSVKNRKVLCLLVNRVIRSQHVLRARFDLQL